MKRDISGWVGAVIPVGFILALYLWSSYQEIYERRPAYLYDPQSDDVYFVELGPSLNPYNRWEIFIPFKGPYYGEPDGAEYIGKLHQVIKEARADRKLLESDFEAWSKKNQREIEELAEEFDTRRVEFEFWDVSYYPRRVDDAAIKLPADLRKIFENEELKSSELQVVDAVVARRTHTLGEKDTDLPVSISIIRKAFLFKGAAVYLLFEEGL